MSLLRRAVFACIHAMAGFVQRLKGNLFLGYRAVIAHPLRKLFDNDERPGKVRFLANYAPEGNIPTSLEDRAVLRGASRCIHCGLCEAYDNELSKLPRTLYDGAALIPVALTRASPDLPRARQLLSRLDPSLLASAEAVCPTRVPLRDLAAYLKRKLDELEREIARAREDRV